MNFLCVSREGYLRAIKSLWTEKKNPFGKKGHCSIISPRQNNFSRRVCSDPWPFSQLKCKCNSFNLQMSVSRLPLSLAVPLFLSIGKLREFPLFSRFHQTRPPGLSNSILRVRDCMFVTEVVSMLIGDYHYINPIFYTNLMDWEMQRNRYQCLNVECSYQGPISRKSWPVT